MKSADVSARSRGAPDGAALPREKPWAAPAAVLLPPPGNARVPAESRQAAAPCRAGDVPPHDVTAPANRLFALDVLRGVAVLLVLVWHWPGRSGSMGPFFVVSKVGWVGVDLFFVLSGFLISGLLYKEWDRCGRLNLRRFWLRRGFKIWPAYFAAFGAAMLLRSAVLWHEQGAAAVASYWHRYLPSVVLVQNYFPDVRQWRYTWSVAVEEHFYLGLPLLMLALAWLRRPRFDAPAPTDDAPSARTPFPRLPLVALFVCVAALAMRVAAAARGAAWDDVHFPTHLRADSLMFGVLLGYYHHYRRPAFERVCRHWPLLLLLVPAALVLPAAFYLKKYPVTYTVGFTLLYLGSGALVALAAVYPGFGHSRRVMRWLAATGRSSYTIYLAHGAMQMLPLYGRAMLAADAAGGLWARRLLFIALALVGGVVLAWLVERPALRLRDRLLPARG